jgi:hypothetical protein|tara:strand:+ start:72 stop:284 length:213 start_codon:yes stop_codon:yes gene_type:complete
MGLSTLMKKNKQYLLIDQLKWPRHKKQSKTNQTSQMKITDKIFLAVGWLLAIPSLIKMFFLHLRYKIFKK